MTEASIVSIDLEFDSSIADHLRLLMCMRLVV